MPTDVLTTHQKALALNLDDKIYGTIAEIGGGQEVARWFFRVGAAAGSVAKTMSAYDKQISDTIYGESGRYVSRERLEAMLDKEYSLLVERLTEDRGRDTRFFAFCDTLSARNYAGTNECHGWVGLKFQSEVGGAANTIILHINMLDDTNLGQQEAAGILGVNLIHCAYFEQDIRRLDSLVHNLGLGRLEADLIDVSGPAFAGFDSISTGMAAVQCGLAQAVLIDGEGRQQPPTEILHKRPAVIRRASQRHTNLVTSGDFGSGLDKLVAELPEDARTPRKIAELSINSVNPDSDISAEQLIAQVYKLSKSNEWVLLTRLGESFRLIEYLRRYSEEPLRYLMGVSTLVLLMSEKYYVSSGSGLLEVTGKLYADHVKIYVHAMPRESFFKHLNSVGLDTECVGVAGDGEFVSLQELSFRGPLQHLFQYLLESGWIEELDQEQGEA